MFEALDSDKHLDTFEALIHACLILISIWILQCNFDWPSLLQFNPSLKLCLLKTLSNMFDFMSVYSVQRRQFCLSFPFLTCWKNPRKGFTGFETGFKPVLLNLSKHLFVAKVESVIQFCLVQKRKNVTHENKNLK